MKRIAVVIIAFCLLLTTGCAGTQSGAVSQKATDIKDMTIESSTEQYAVEPIDFPQNIWFNQTAIISNNEKIYLLGTFLDCSFLYSMNYDGSDVQLLSSCDDGTELWTSYCILNDKIYVYDFTGHQLVELNLSGERLNNITIHSDIKIDSIFACGNEILAIGDGEITSIPVIQDKDATLQHSIKVSPHTTIGCGANDTIYVAWQNEGKQAISILDIEEKALGEPRYFDANFTIVGCGSEWELYLRIGTALYGYNFSTNRLQKLLSFSDYGLLSNGVVYEIGSGKLIYTGTRGDTASPPFLLSSVENTSESVKLTLATLGELHPRIRDAVLIWNQTHPNIRIEIKDYSAFGTQADSRGAELKLIADIAAGDSPDLYNLSDFGTTMNASLLARRNLLEDLYPYIDNDLELSRDDFFTGPLHSLEINGGLYQVSPAFLLLTTTAVKQDAGSPDQWTYNQLEYVVAEKDYYDYLFDPLYNRNDWLEVMVTASGKKLIDWSTGQCYFDSDYFIHLLEIAKTRPSETEVVGGSLSSLIHDARSLLFMHTFRDVWQAGGLASAYGEENFVFVGLPEIGSVLIPETSIGMSSSSLHKEQCWAFLREFLTKDSTYVSGLPLRRDIANQRLLDELEAMKEYPNPKPGREQAMKDLLAEMEKVNTLYQTDTQLWNIIIREINAYFAGQKSEKETAEAVQSRAILYLSEQS